MKNFLVLLLAVFLLGSVPKEEWNKGTREQQVNLLQKIAEIFAPVIKCSSGKIAAFQEKENVNIYFECEKYVNLQSL